MNFFIVLGVTILFSVSAFAVPIDDRSDKQSGDDRVCRPGASYSDGCNDVTCLPNHAVIRTEKACFTYDSNGEPVPTPELEAPEDFWQKTAETKKPAERICKPGASYHDGCNNVWCGPNNVHLSTQKACFHMDSNGHPVSLPHLEPPEDFWLKE